MTPVTNNKDLRDEENNHGQVGHEIILHSMPNPNEDEMPATANHLEDDEEDEMHSSNTNRGCRVSRSRALTAFLATAGVGAVVGGGSVVFRAASGGKTSISSSMQAAVVQEVEGYDIIIGVGPCLDENNDGYPNIKYSEFADPASTLNTAQLCANKCEECVEDTFDSKYVGFYHDSEYPYGCFCLVSNPVDPAEFDQFNNDVGPCGKVDSINSSALGSGPVKSTLGVFTSITCYGRVEGGGGTSNSKSGKTKASKAPNSTN